MNKIIDGGNCMLKKFEVTNFMGFKDKISLDFSDHKDYEFNKGFIKNNIINKALIYGKNGTGKSNLGYAIFDITYHLTDKRKLQMRTNNYTNGDNDKKFATFVYVFQFGDNEIKYEYAKTNPLNLLYEKLYVNNELILNYDFTTKNFVVLKINGAENYNKNITENVKTVIRNLYYSVSLTEDSPIRLMVDFVDRMLWFRCIDEGPQFSGYMELPKLLADMINENSTVEDFEKFLNDNDLNYDLNIKKDIINNLNVIMAKYKYTEFPLNAIWSTGTHALTLFYCWSLEFNKVSFLYLDEFDAFYHYETSEYVLKILNKNENLQSIVTSHNTYLMNNSLTRPDCCFIISNNKVQNLCNCTNKEIREAHNLEKMYRNGIFEN